MDIFLSTNEFYFIFMLFMFHLQILWENRKKGDIGNDCLISVDGTDCPIQKRWSWETGRKVLDKRFYSHKFNGHGLRYEVAISILNSDIVWIAGPYMPGKFNDLMIFRDGLRQELDQGERCEADDGYRGDFPKYCKCPSGYTGGKKSRKNARKSANAP